MRMDTAYSTATHLVDLGHVFLIHFPKSYYTLQGENTLPRFSLHLAMPAPVGKLKIIIYLIRSCLWYMYGKGKIVHTK